MYWYSFVFALCRDYNRIRTGTDVFCQSDNLWIRFKEPQFSPDWDSEELNVREFPVFVQLALVGPNGTAAKRINQTESVNGRVTCQETDRHPTGTSTPLYIKTSFNCVALRALERTGPIGDAQETRDGCSTLIAVVWWRVTGSPAPHIPVWTKPSPQRDENNPEPYPHPSVNTFNLSVGNLMTQRNCLVFWSRAEATEDILPTRLAIVIEKVFVFFVIVVH